jgi:hypothetical protein
MSHFFFFLPSCPLISSVLSPLLFPLLLTIVSHTLIIACVLANARQSCVSMEYAQHPQSQVVQTSWAVLALIYGEYPDVEVIKKACNLLMSRQKEDGRWEQEDTEGIFNKNCAIDYPGMSPFHSLILRSLPLLLHFFAKASLFFSPWLGYEMRGIGSQLINSIQIHLLYLGIG